MFKVLAVVCVLAVSLEHAHSLQPPINGSYWDQARNTVGPSLLRALTLLPSLKPTSSPGDVKTLRVALLESRELLDVFGFAYPVCSPNSVGMWTCACKGDVPHPPPAPPPARVARPPPGSSHHGQGKKGHGDHGHDDHEHGHEHGGHADDGHGHHDRHDHHDGDHHHAHGTGHGNMHHDRRLLAAHGHAAHHSMGLAGQEVLRRKDDLLLLLRADLDAGYETIGNFQDLDHSLVQYNQSDMEALREQCLQWQSRMVVNADRYKYLQYLANPCKHTLVRHAHLSKLFWGYNGHVPQASLSAAQNLGILVRDCQLQQLMDNYTNLLNLETIWVEPDHGHFHLFRKEIRSVLAVLQFFPGLVPDKIQSLTPASRRQPDDPPAQGNTHLDPSAHRQPDDAHTLVRLWREAVGAAKSAAAAVVQAVERARAAMHDGGVGAGAGAEASIHSGVVRRLAAGTIAQTKKHDDSDSVGSKDGDDVCAVPGANPECSYGFGDATCRPWCVMPLLSRVKLGLGDINDKVFAYEFYGEHGLPAEAEAARQDVMRNWRTLRGCMRTWQFAQQVACLQRSLPRADGSST